MKRISERVQHAQEEERILRHLSFIKAKKRFPFNKNLALHLIWTGAITLVWVYYLFRIAPFHHSDYPLASFIIFLLFAIIVVSLLKRRWDILRFFPVRTNLGLSDNEKVVENFLRAKQIAYSRHPKAPEVFMIISKNVSAYSDEREVALFIADEKYILINCHFTSSKKWILFPAVNHHVQLISELKSFLNSSTVV